MVKTYVRNSLIERQNRDYACTEKIYGVLPSVGEELQDASATQIGQVLGITVTQMRALAADLEAIGALSRRIEYNAMINGERKQGRSAYWKLTLDRVDTLKKLKEYHANERAKADHAPVARITSPKSISLKSRIIEALNDQSFKTVDELAAQVMGDGRKIDFHNLTHVLYSLRKENKIAFENGRTKDRVPFNIRLAKNGTKPKPEVEPPPAADYPNPFIEDNWPLPASMEKEESKKTLAELFPIINRLKDRRLLLEQAAKLAEDANETDLAITLLEKAGTGTTPLEQEAVRLFEAHLRCLSQTV